jgi:hypothetical protein
MDPQTSWTGQALALNVLGMGEGWAGDFHSAGQTGAERQQELAGGWDEHRRGTALSPDS